MTLRIFTLGHSTHPIEVLLAMLDGHGVRQLVDVRTVPRSGHNPQYNREELAHTLERHGLLYRHMAELGGLRQARRDSSNSAWRNASFRGYADYMQTPAFAAAVDALMAAARELPTAIMCAEAVPWRCHRSMIADALLVRGVEVLEIESATRARALALHAFAHVDGVRITYPGEQQELFPG